MTPVELEPPFRRTLSLGWRITIASSIVVLAVMLPIMAVQHHGEALWESHVASQALVESLRPLAAQIRRAQSLEDIERDLRYFHEAYISQAENSHFVALSDATGRHLFGFPPPLRLSRTGSLVMGSLPVESAVIPGRDGVLFVWDSGRQHDEALGHQRRLWYLHVVLTLAGLLLAVHGTTYLLLSRPLNKLLDRVRLMQMGYWGAVPPTEGPWEIRWLGWRFQKVGEQLQLNARHLVEAERRALQLSQATERPPQVVPPTADILEGTLQHRNLDTARSLSRLEDKCTRLRLMDPDTRVARATAKQIWEEEAMEAERLGSYHLRCRLEDAALGVLEPSAYPAYKDKLLAAEESVRQLMAELQVEITDLLTKRGVPFFRVDFRMKHPASAWKKSAALGVPLEELHDLLAFRVLAPSIPDCYWALGALHERFEPVLGTFKDYIALPKTNGYQSLHTCIRAKGGQVIEVQIRTSAMHRWAEQDTAAHWLYKENQKAPSRWLPPRFMSALAKRRD